MCAHMHQTPRSKNTLNTLITSHTCEASCLRVCIPTATEFVLEQIIWLLFINIYIYITCQPVCDIKCFSAGSLRGKVVPHKNAHTHTHAHHHTGTLPQTNRIMSEENCVQRIRTRAHFVVSVVCLGGISRVDVFFFFCVLCSAIRSVGAAVVAKWQPHVWNGERYMGMCIAQNCTTYCTDPILSLSVCAFTGNSAVATCEPDCASGPVSS